MLKSLSIFLLAYNEEENIEKACFSAVSVAKKIAKKYEVIVILYEGSKDNTRNIVKELMKKYKNLKLIIQPMNKKGYVSALKIGVQSCKYDYIFYSDSDNQFDFKEIHNFLPYVEKYDIISGIRGERKDPFMRILAAGVYNRLLNIFFNTKIKDIDCAFKIYKKKIFENFNINSSTGMADAEILIKSIKKGYKIKQLPVSHFSRFAGTPQFEAGALAIIKPKVVIDLLRDMGKLWIDVNIKKKF